MEDRLDLLLLGATGFTGRRCIPYLHKLCKSNGQHLTWGIAGRSEEKLKRILKNAETECGTDLQEIPIIVVDITDPVSVEKMAKGARVIINCCGPFRFLGETVVKACIAAGTHHVDISAEPQFMEKLELELNEEAKEKGVYIVTACGFDCLPSDLGVVYLQQQFEGTLNSINTYLDVWLKDGNTDRSVIGYNSNSVINSGTWESLVHCVANWKEISGIRKKLFPETMSKFQPSLQQKFLPHTTEVLEGWSLPLPTADSASIKRTQKYFFQAEAQRPTQANTYFVVKSYFQVILLAIFLVALYPFTRCKFGTRLLCRNPALFTLGVIRRAPPTEKVVKNTWYQVTLYGEGWREKVGHDVYEHDKPCDRCILGRVSGRDGYELTCLGVVLSAIVVISEKNKLPKNGGVFSAGACFAKTSLIKQLSGNGVDFQVIYKKDL